MLSKRTQQAAVIVGALAVVGGVGFAATPWVRTAMQDAGYRAAVERSNAEYDKAHPPTGIIGLEDPRAPATELEKAEWSAAVLCTEHKGVIDKAACAAANEAVEAARARDPEWQARERAALTPPFDYESEVAAARLEPESDGMDGAN